MKKPLWIVLGPGACWSAAASASGSGASTRRPTRRRATRRSRVDRGPIVAKVTATGTLSALVTVQVGSAGVGAHQGDQRRLQLAGEEGAGDRARSIRSCSQAALEQAQRELPARRRANVAQGRRRRPTTPSASSSARKALREQKLDRAGRSRHRARPTPTPPKAQRRRGAGGSSRRRSAALHQAQVNLDYTTIVSPIDGVGDLAQRRRRADRGGVAAGADAVHDRRGPAQDAGRHQRRRGRRRQAQAGHDATFTVDAYPGRALQGHGPADPQRAADACRTSSPTTR